MKWLMQVGTRLHTLVLLIAALTVLAPAQTEQNPSPARADLAGTVKDNDGKPISQASVFIYTAGPKEGTGILCPSCYADCRKHTTTDSNGRFKIESLDPMLLFRILVVAKGKEPKFVPKVDPATKPLDVALKPAREGLKADQQMK